MTAAKDEQQYRLECEAREWLSRGYTNRSAVDALILRIAAQRGQAAADRLREAMRKEYQKREANDG